MDKSHTDGIAVMGATHLDDLPRVQLVQDIREVPLAFLDSKPDPGKVERSKATRRDTLRRELTGTRERDNVILSECQDLCRQGQITPDLTIGSKLFRR